MLWINISNILYESKFSGIIRTEYELCVHAFELKQNGHDIGFCHYDVRKGFVIVNDDILNKRLHDLKNGIAVRHIRLPFFPRLIRSLLKKICLIQYMFGYVHHPFCDNDTIIGVGQAVNTNEMNALFKIKHQINLTVKLLCHDLMPISTPQFVFENVTKDFEKYIQGATKVADFFFCNSKYTKQELTDYYQKHNLPLVPMQVVTLGCDLHTKHIDETPDDRVHKLIKTPYLLFVSTIEIRKNHRLIYDVYTKLIKMGMDNLPKMYFVGRRGWKVDEFLHEMENDEAIKDHIVILSDITDSQLLQLYRHCWFTVYPSFIEGYGLPVAESLSMGKYCLSSNAGSLPEAGGDYIDYLSPHDVDAWCEKLLFLINHPDYVAQKEQYIKEHYKPVSWQSFAQEILKNEL